MSEKLALRQHMKSMREELAARDPDAADKVAENFPLKLLERYGPEVAGYLPIGAELDPQPLMARLMSAGAQLSLPRVSEDQGLSFHRWTPGLPLERGRFGLSQPLESADRVTPTLLLMPLLAFDNQGNRLGYGQGHYDRTISALRTSGRVFTCGLAFHGQLLDALPAEPHDEPLDWAQTEAGAVPLFMMRNLKAIAGAGEDGPDAA